LRLAGDFIVGIVITLAYNAKAFACAVLGFIVQVKGNVNAVACPESIERDYLSLLIA
jgi:hypothetical protein